MRVNMSAIGSVMLMRSSSLFSSRIPGGRGGSDGESLPACLAHAGDHPVEREFSEADTAEAEAAQVRLGAAAAVAPVLVAHLELRLPLGLFEQRFRRH